MGVVCFSTAPPVEQGTDWETLAAESADLQLAAEVVVGRSDLLELTSLGIPRIDGSEVSWPNFLLVASDVILCEMDLILSGLAGLGGVKGMHQLVFF